MNQPDLGLKISELRRLKNLTQEQLAEKCEVSTRTIQRIESGEVDPRAYTIQRLGEILEFDFEESNQTNENLWLTILHLSSVLCMLIIPLVLWSWKKTQSFKINMQGRQVLNFQITMTLLLFAAGFFLIAMPLGLVAIVETQITRLQISPAFMLLAVCAPAPLILIGIFCTYQGVINTVRALSDRPIHYSLSIPFIK
jgi:uncharacterized Tic20 family protein